jgi:tetratricopeptide (TPR) repeat protein
VKVKSGIYVAIFVLLISLIGCTDEKSVVSNLDEENSPLVKEALKLGNEALQKKQYDKAKTLFNIVLQNDPQNKEAFLIKGIIFNYTIAKEQFEKMNVEEARRRIDFIDEQYTNYAIKNDIDSLKEQIVNEIKKKESIDNEINKVSKLYSNKDKHSEAFDIITKLSSMNLSDSQQIRLVDMVAYARSYISRPIEGAFKEKLEKVEKEISENGETRPEEIKRWEATLNEMLDTIKKSVSEEQVKKINEVQTLWELYKNKKAQSEYLSTNGSIASSLKVSSVLIDTRNRCYVLADMYGSSFLKMTEREKNELEWWESRLNESKLIIDTINSSKKSDLNTHSFWNAYITLLAEEAALLYKGTKDEDHAYKVSYLRSTMRGYVDFTINLAK